MNLRFGPANKFGKLNLEEHSILSLFMVLIPIFYQKGITLPHDHHKCKKTTTPFLTLSQDLEEIFFFYNYALICLESSSNNI